LICQTPALSVEAISAAVLPTPENTMRPAGTPPATARLNSPPDTTSAPAPRRARVRMTPMLPLALTAKQTVAGRPAKPAAKTS